MIYRVPALKGAETLSAGRFMKFIYIKLPRVGIRRVSVLLSFVPFFKAV